MALGSKAMAGTPELKAAAIAGPEAYPPTPKTTPGLNSRMRRLQAKILRGRSARVRSRVIRDTFLSWPTLIRWRLKAGFGNETALHAARCADKEHLGHYACNQFAGHRQRRNDVASGAAAGDQNAEFVSCACVEGIPRSPRTCSLAYRSKGAG